MEHGAPFFSGPFMIESQRYVWGASIRSKSQLLCWHRGQLLSGGGQDSRRRTLGDKVTDHGGWGTGERLQGYPERSPPKPCPLCPITLSSHEPQSRSRQTPGLSRCLFSPTAAHSSPDPKQPPSPSPTFPYPTHHHLPSGAQTLLTHFIAALLSKELPPSFF